MNLVQLSDMMRERADRGLDIKDLNRQLALGAILNGEFKDGLVKILLDEVLFRYKCRVDEENRKPWFSRLWRFFGKSPFQTALESYIVALKEPKPDYSNILRWCTEELQVLDNGRYAVLREQVNSVLLSVGITVLQEQGHVLPPVDLDPVRSAQGLTKSKAIDPVLGIRVSTLCQRAKEVEGELESLLSRIDQAEKTEARLSKTVPGFSAADSVALKSETLRAYAEACCPALINGGLGARVVVSQHSLAVNAFLVDRTEEISGTIVALEAQEPSVLGAEPDAQVPFLQNTTPLSLEQTILKAIASLYDYDEHKDDSKLTAKALMAHVKIKAGGWNWFGFTPSEYETVNKLLKAAEQPIDDAAMMAALRRIERLEKLDKHLKKTTMFSEMRSAFASAHFSSSDKNLFTKTTEEVKNANDSLALQGEHVYEQYVALEKQFGNLNEGDDLIDINSRHFRAKKKDDLKRLVYYIAHVNLLPKGLSFAERSNALGANLDDSRYVDLLKKIDDAGLFEASPSLYFVVLMISVELVRQKTKAINRVDSGEGYSKLQSLLSDFLTNRQADMRLRFDVNEEKKETEFNTVLVKELSETEFSWLLNYIPNKIAYPGSTCALAASALSVKLIGVNGTFPPRLQQSTSVDSNRSSVASVDSGTPDRRKSLWGFGGFGFGTPGRSVSQDSQAQMILPLSGPPSSEREASSFIHEEKGIAISRVHSTSHIKALPQNKASGGSAVDQNGAVEETTIDLPRTVSTSSLRSGRYYTAVPQTPDRRGRQSTAPSSPASKDGSVSFGWSSVFSSPARKPKPPTLEKLTVKAQELITRISDTSGEVSVSKEEFRSFVEQHCFFQCFQPAFERENYCDEHQHAFLLFCVIEWYSKKYKGVERLQYASIQTELYSFLAGGWKSKFLEDLLKDKTIAPRDASFPSGPCDELNIIIDKLVPRATNTKALSCT